MHRHLLCLTFLLGLHQVVTAQCPNRCLDFDPANTPDYVQPASSPVTGDANFTVEARFLCGSTSTFTRRLFALNGSNNRFEIAESGGVLRLIRQVVGGSTVTVNLTSTNVRDNQWHHLAALRNGSTIRVYLDGVQIYSIASFTGTLALTTFRIGGSVLSVGSTFHWDGLIDEVRVWDVERTAAQINAYRLCQAPCPTTGLKAYYHFNQGIPAGNNPNETTLTDCTGQFNGVLQAFALTGSISNWVCSTDAAFTDAPCCAAAFTYAQTQCGTVNFTNTTTGDHTYVWNFGDGSTSTQVSPAHTYPANGTYTVTLTATPPNGSPCTTQQTITVTSEDVQPPNLVCKNITVNLSGVSISILPEDVLESATDNCCQNIPLSLVGQSVYTCADACMTRTVTLVATDCNGNSSTCTAQVTVADVTVPVIACNDMVNVAVGPTGTVTLVPAQLLEGMVIENCNTLQFNLTPATLPCPANGCSQTHTVTLRVSDCSGNVAACFSQVVVEDKNPPSLTCPPNAFLSAQTNSCVAFFTPNLLAADNCDAALDLSFSMTGSTNAGGMGTGSTTPIGVGVTLITYTATDGCGNAATCTLQVTVVDVEQPIVICPSNIVQTAPVGSTGMVINWASVPAFDNCGAVSLTSTHQSGDVFPCGVTTVVYEATDLSGNRTTCSFTVTVECVDCGCGEFTDLVFSQNGGTEVPFKCGDFLAVGCPVLGSTLTLTGNFLCAGDTSCAPTNFQLVNSDGTPIGSGVMSGGTFTWSFSGFFITNPGWYELYLQTICGGITCRCPVRFTVPDCPPALPCDQVSATAKPLPAVPGQPKTDCCHEITISNGVPNLATSINLQVLSGGSLLYTNVSPAAGWSINGFSGGTSVSLAHSSGQVPTGTYACGRICLTSLTASPQVLAVQYLDANGKVVCADTLTLECAYCITIREEKLECDSVTNQPVLTFCLSVPASNGFVVNSVVLTGPAGVSFSPAAFPVPGVPPGGTYCSFTTTITLAPGFQPDSLCIMFTAHQMDITKGQPPGECCMIKACFDLPDCCENTATATAVDTTDGHCCWQITLQQPAGTAQYVTLNVIPVPGTPVTVQAIASSPSWYFNVAPGQQSVVFIPTPASPLPASVVLPDICFQVPAGSPVPQLLEVVWGGNLQGPPCRDTLEFFCQPDTDCVALTPGSILCDPAAPGQSTYTVTVTHPFNSTLTITPTHVALVDVTPSGAVVGSGIFPLGSFPAGSSTTIPITLQGVPGTQVCFGLNLYSNPAPNVFRDCCVTSDTFCVTLPDCGLQNGLPLITLFPNPTSEAFTLDFGAKGSPPQGRVRVRDPLGRLLLEEEIPASTQRHQVHVSVAGAGLFFVEFLEDNNRMWSEKLSILR